MNNLLLIVPIAAGAFVATNLDNLMILVSLLARFRSRKLHVITGYFSAALIICLLGFWIGAVADEAPVQYLGLLGIVPIAIGSAELFRLFRSKSAEIDTEDEASESGHSAFIATLFTQLSNGADTVVTFGALFADSVASTNLMIIMTLVAMTVIFMFIAIHTTTHPKLGNWIERYGPRITPFILIAVGVYIITNTATDLLPG